MVERLLHTIGRSWLPVNSGTIIVLLCVGVGWTMAAAKRALPVRVVTWWLDCIVVPLLNNNSWWRRVLAIFVNNSLISVIMIAAGRWSISAWAAVVVVGLSLGIGLRVVRERSRSMFRTASLAEQYADRRMIVGVLLNGFEPPAIALTIGLCLAQSAMPTPVATSDLWLTFALAVLPMLAIAACGEAMWLGVLVATRQDGE